ncbi:MAG: elongation factor G, partial [Planctomycetota bacterium]|nr:elongation factor G [Planctomycetota bacterium]
GPQNTVTGDTLCSKNHPVILERMVFPEPVMSVAIEPQTQSERKKMEEAIQSLMKEDPTFKMRKNEETGETLISGMGELHLEILTKRIVEEFNVKARVGKPQVAYKQTVRESAEISYEYNRVVGLQRHKGRVRLWIEPSSKISDVVVDNRTEIGKINSAFVASVNDGVNFAIEGGIGYGFPFVGMKVIFAAEEVDVDGTELGYYSAAVEGMRKGVLEAKLRVLEPKMRLEVHTPQEFVGEVLSDLGTRAATIEEIETIDDLKIVRGTVAVSKMFGYATLLRSITQGKGAFTMEPTGYVPVPEEVAESLGLFRIGVQP